MVVDDRLRAAVRACIDREGRKFVDHPADRGGCSKFGITRPVLAQFVRDHGVTCADIAELDEETAVECYMAFWIMDPKNRYDLLPARVLEPVLDTAILFGAPRANRWLQAIVETDIDGWIGPKTRYAIEHYGLERMIQALVDERILHHAHTVTLAPDQSVFLLGWIRRALALRP